MNFLELHKLFEDYYKEAQESIDNIAERILMLGGRPLCTIKEYLEFAVIKEPSTTQIRYTRDKLSHLHNIIYGMVYQLKKTTAIAKKIDDDVSVDLLVSKISSFEKKQWFINAMLTQTPKQIELAKLSKN